MRFLSACANHNSKIGEKGPRIGEFVAGVSGVF
jgi:hypothetical protein